jgi:hypothetical protein
VGELPELLAEVPHEHDAHSLPDALISDAPVDTAGAAHEVEVPNPVHVHESAPDMHELVHTKLPTYSGRRRFEHLIDAFAAPIWRLFGEDKEQGHH